MSDTSQFSERETEVIEFLLQGKSNKQIALALGISASTVEYHLKNVYKKLQVSSRTEAVLRLGKSIGGNSMSELGKSTVEMNGETTDNGLQPISTRRIPMNKTFAIIGSGLLALGLIVVLLLVRAVVNTSPQNKEFTPTNISPLPDLTITSAYVSMVDNNGFCLPYYGFNVTVANQGNAPALNVILADSTGQEIGVGDLNPQQNMSISFAANGAYTVVADPQNIIIESDENNNTATSSDATATPFASCLPSQFVEGTPTPSSTLAPLPTVPQVTPGAIAPTLSLDILQNGTYRSPDWGEFQLSDGVYYRTPPTSQESPETYTTLLSDTVIYGDINADGFEDAIVFLNTQNGGAGHFIEMAAVLNLNGNPVNVETVYLGNRVVIVESGTIEGGLITLTLRVQGPNDPACCPSQIVEKKFYIDAFN